MMGDAGLCFVLPPRALVVVLTLPGSELLLFSWCRGEWCRRIVCVFFFLLMLALLLLCPPLLSNHSPALLLLGCPAGWDTHSLKIFREYTASSSCCSKGGAQKKRFQVRHQKPMTHVNQRSAFQNFSKGPDSFSILKRVFVGLHSCRLPHEGLGGR